MLGKLLLSKDGVGIVEIILILALVLGIVLLLVRL